MSAFLEYRQHGNSWKRYKLCWLASMFSVSAASDPKGLHKGDRSAIWCNVSVGMMQVQVDLDTPSASTATLRRNLMEFFDNNHKEFVPGGGTVIFLASEDPLKMTLGVVYTFAHNGKR